MRYIVDVKVFTVVYHALMLSVLDACYSTAGPIIVVTESKQVQSHGSQASVLPHVTPLPCKTLREEK